MIETLFFSTWGIVTTACCAVVGIYVLNEAREHRANGRRTNTIICAACAAPLLVLAVWSAFHTVPRFVRQLAELF